jgi:hypothetical protein
MYVLYINEEDIAENEELKLSSGKACLPDIQNKLLDACSHEDIGIDETSP